MKHFFAVITALFVMGISFLYPITAYADLAVSDGYTNDYTLESANDLYIYLSMTTNKFSKDFYVRIPSTSVNDLEVTQEGQLMEFDFSDCANTRIYWRYNQNNVASYNGSGGSSGYFDTLYVNTVTGQVNAYLAQSPVALYDVGRSPAASYTSNYPNYVSYNYLTDTCTFDTNWTAPNPLNLDFTFNPALSGTVNRTTTVSGIDYTADKFSMSVYNGGENARFAMFIVPTGDTVSFSYGGWDSTMEISSNPVFAFVTDEWTSSGANFDNLSMTNQTYSPSFLHYIASGGYQSYEIAWSSMNLSANTSYDVVCYGCLGSGGSYDGQSGMALNDEFEEVYRRTFSVVNPAVYSPDNDITSNYSWDSSKETMKN